MEESKSYRQYTETQILNRCRSQPGWRGRVVLYYDKVKEINDYTVCVNALVRLSYRLELKKATEDTYEAYIDKELLLSGKARNNKEAVRNLGPKILAKMQEFCFTIEVIKENALEVDIQKPFFVHAAQQPEIPSHNIGRKMLSRMGWSGKGLGKYNTGILEPVIINSGYGTCGLGSGPTLDASDADQLRSNVQTYFEHFIQNKDLTKLVFPNTLDKEQRCEIHRLASRYNLKTHSYTHLNTKQLCASKKLELWNLVEELLKDPTSEIYNLIYPSNLPDLPSMPNRTVE